MKYTIVLVVLLCSAAYASAPACKKVKPPITITTPSQEQTQNQNQTVETTANNQQITNDNQVRQAPPAIPPEAFSSAPCRIAGSTALSGPIGGISGGFSKQDKDCAAEHLAAYYFTIGAHTAGCKILVRMKASQQAGITMEDCLVQTIPLPTQEAPVVIPSPRVLEVLPTVIYMPAPEVKPIFKPKVSKATTKPKTKPCSMVSEK